MTYCQAKNSNIFIPLSLLYFFVICIVVQLSSFERVHGLSIMN